MNATTLQKCTLAGCGKRVIWATTAKGKAIPLEPDPVDPGHHGALCLVGSQALGRVDAVRRIAQMFSVDEATADAKARDDYGWYVAHMPFCAPWLARRRR